MEAIRELEEQVRPASNLEKLRRLSPSRVGGGGRHHDDDADSVASDTSDLFGSQDTEESRFRSILVSAASASLHCGDYSRHRTLNRALVKARLRHAGGVDERDNAEKQARKRQRKVRYMHVLAPLYKNPVVRHRHGTQDECKLTCVLVRFCCADHARILHSPLYRAPRRQEMRWTR